MSKRSLCVVCALLLLPAVVAAQEPVDPAMRPARDSHEDLLVTADPYQDAARGKELFGKKTPFEAGILAVDVYFRNDNEVPILIDLKSIRLLLEPPTGQRQQLVPLDVEDVLERMLSDKEPDVSIPRRPLPGTKPKSKRTKEYVKLEATLRPLVLATDLVPPKGTVRGFLFFYLGRQMERARYARLYIPHLQYMHNKQPLFYFEVNLAAAKPLG